MPGFFSFLTKELRGQREEALAEERKEEALEFEEHLRQEELNAEPEPEPQVKPAFPELTPELEPEANPEPKQEAMPEVAPEPAAPRPLLRRRLWAGMEPPAPYPTESDET